MLLKNQHHFTCPILHIFADGEPPAKKKTTLRDVTISKLQTRYCKQLPTTRNVWLTNPVSQYVCLALVHKDTATSQDQNLAETTKLTTEGEVDKILERRKPLKDLKEIFYCENDFCPQVILITGAAGEY